MRKNVLKSKVVFFFSIGIILFSAASGYSQEEDIAKYPSRPITYIIPYPPGAGGSDLSSRLLAKEAEKYLGKPIVPVNKPGAAVGTAAIAMARPDGYTLGFGGQTPMLFIPLLENVPYHPVRDLIPIIQFGGFNMGVIIKADSPFKNFQDLISYARQNPKKITYGATPNSLLYVNIERIAKKENIQITFIPFKGAPEMQTALLGGHISFGVGDFNYSLLEAGQVRLLLLLKEENSAEYPQTPILKDLGYGDIPAPLIQSVIGPKGMAEGIIKKLEFAFGKAMTEPGFVKGMQELRLPIIRRSSKELSAYVSSNYENLTRLLKEMGITK